VTTIESEAVWGPAVRAFQSNGKDLGPVKKLFLLGCYTGAGVSGLRLLKEMSELIGAPVAAPTGLWGCTGTGDFIEHGAVIQEVAPGKPFPAPIRPPKWPPPEPLTIDQSDEVASMIGIPEPEDIVRISVEINGDRQVSLSWTDPKQMPAVRRKLFGRRPITTPGPLNLGVVGSASVYVHDSNGERALTFSLLAQGIIEIAKNLYLFSQSEATLLDSLGRL
jgi:hypothetical protein